MRNSRTLYLPYGAYELKATYQRNMLYANLIVMGLVLLALTIARINRDRAGGETVVIAQTVIRTVADLGPPPAIVKKPPPGESRHGRGCKAEDWNPQARGGRRDIG